MLARLIEAWTDSTNERAYQPAFLQMLVARGHHVLHNTRHGPLEFGKDVITRDIDGTLCAFQLKGHPGGRLRKRDVAEMLDQLKELLFLHVRHPNVARNARHRAFLVTNGEIDEEAHAAIEALRAGLSSDTAAISLEVIARGDFVKWAIDLEAGLWPQEIDDWRRLLEILGMSGTAPLPVDRLILLLDGILGSCAKKTEIRRKASSAAVFTALALRDFSLRGNHLAEATAWVVFSTRVLALAERSGLSLKTVDPFVDVAENAIKTSLVRLALEAQVGPVPTSGGLGENIAYHYRLPLLCGIAGLLSFWVDQSESDLHAGLRTFLSKHTPSCTVWGEGAIPSILMAVWALGLTGDLLIAEMKLTSTLAEILARALGKGPPLYGPYWSPEAIMIHSLAPLLLPADDPMRDESGHGDLYLSEALLQLLVRHNLKTVCKKLWPAFSKISICQFLPATPLDYYEWEAERGMNGTTIPPNRKPWASLVEESYSTAHSLPTGLSQRPFLTAVLCLILPQRCTTPTVRFLADQFDSSWSRGAGKLVPAGGSQ